MSLAVIIMLLSSTLAWADGDVTSVSDLTALDGESGTFTITRDIDASTFGSSIASFSGTLQADINTATGMPYRIKNLKHPLFTTLTGTVKNLVIESCNISDDGMVGAIASTASGSARIYNVGILSGSVKSTGSSDAADATDCCGGLVGLLDGEARVVYCYSYADITGGNRVGGIVGYNNVGTTSSNLKTMVFGCLFYGDITGGENIAPIYNGTIITNSGEDGINGVNGFNYVRAEASYVQELRINTYHCALLAETRFLQRFEFFRNLLNGYRELAAWWVTGDRTNTSEMMKWVMLPDSIGTAHPYPILKPWGKYPSVVNYDAGSAAAFTNTTTHQPRNKGRKFGTLTVKVRMGSGGAVYGPPVGASIPANTSLTLNILDKDPDHFNFNYYKVQLPYYNDIGTNNYRKASDGTSRVVTGWKIVEIKGGTDGTFSTSTADAPSYNFVDRNCTQKDLYSVSGRVFNQGAYWDVPEGVYEITIEPYWARCAYLSDGYMDVVYKNTMSNAVSVPNVGDGQRFNNKNNYDIAGEQQKVYTYVGDARGQLGLNANHTVYDHAIVLVGNFHNIGVSSGDASHLYTIMSADFDHDNEPDYSYIIRFNSRTACHPVRVDFLNMPGLGMAQKTTGTTGTYNYGILNPLGWFESTNTSLFRVTQFEYDHKSRGAAPIIVHGGVMEQWVSGQSNGAANKTTYFYVGGNAWFKEFHRGTHQDQKYTTKHPPVSVSGGDYDEFYLTGLYRGDVANYEDNAECYINGGHFGILAGTGMEGIGKDDGADNTGNITWLIQNADIREFYAGGINAAHPVEGNITTTVKGGKIDLFVGGPKFGDMNTDKTVVTTATDCIFGTFFGAGYGGNSYSRQAPFNHNNIINFPHNNAQAGNDASWNAWLSRFYLQNYNATYGGVSTQFSYQFLPMSGNVDNVARIYVEYVKFSLATTREVTTTLTGCTVTDNFYGGGSLGKVAGSVHSTLDGCTVKGNVFGAGYSASLPDVEVDAIGFSVEPYYYKDMGTYRPGVKGPTTTYTWHHGNAISVDNTLHKLYTTENLNKNNLGSVTTATLIIKGASIIGTSGDTTTGHVYGGGDESSVGGNTTVTIGGDTEVLGNVFGGGNQGTVGGTTTVNIQNIPDE